MNLEFESRIQNVDSKLKFSGFQKFWLSTKSVYDVVTNLTSHRVPTCQRKEPENIHTNHQLDEVFVEIDAQHVENELQDDVDESCVEKNVYQ